MNRIVSFACLLLLAAPALAKPPGSRGFMRMDDLRAALAAKQQKLTALEEFTNKPLMERVFIKFTQGEDKYEKLDLTAEKVVKLLLKWDAMDAPEPSEAVQRVLNALPAALKARFDKIPIPRRDRHKASKPLVEALTHKHYHVRKAVFEALKLMYRYPSGHFYQPDATEKLRKEKQKVWKRYIDREAKR